MNAPDAGVAAGLATISLDEQLACVEREIKMRERAVRARLVERQSEATRARRQTETRRAELEREIERLTDAIAAVGISPAIADRLRKAESTLAGLDGPVGRLPGPDVGRDLRARLRATALDLQGALGRDTARARGILRELLGEVRLEPDGEAVYAAIEPAADRLLVAAGDVSLGLVAGDRNQTRLRVR